MSWMGEPMMNPEGKIGIVICDSNGPFRILTVEFEDGIKEDLILENIGENPKRSQEWKWLFKKKDKEPEWCRWGF